MYLIKNQSYMEDLRKMSEKSLPWERLIGTHVLISGATGLIGRNLIDLLMYMNDYKDLNCYMTVISRNSRTAQDIFPEYYFQSEYFSFVSHDICNPLTERRFVKYDYILHLASNTHPRAYASRPIETILTNVLGTRNLLDLCVEYTGCRFVFPSSVEIYGENRGDTELFDEKYMGFLDSNTLRAGYSESKRVCEALCQAYIKERNVQAVIPRLPRVYGPTMGRDDSKAAAQFIKKAVSGEDIVLKSDGNQHYSFLYVTDAVIGILTTMFLAKNGEVYNIANELCDGTLKEIANICANVGDVNLSYELPDEIERQGYSTATKARLDGNKIKTLGWQPSYNLEEGLQRTITILKQTHGVIV